MTRDSDRPSPGTVDLADLLIRVENDRDLLRELIGIFNEEFPRLLKSLKQSVAREDMKNVEAVSHALKGMLSGLSVMQAAAMASRLEEMARTGEKSALSDVLTLLEREVADLLPELNTYAAGEKS